MSLTSRDDSTFSETAAAILTTLPGAGQQPSRSPSGHPQGRVRLLSHGTPRGIDQRLVIRGNRVELRVIAIGSASHLFESGCPDLNRGPLRPEQSPGKFLPSSSFGGSGGIPSHAPDFGISR